MAKEVSVKDTPASRWAKKYKQRYFTTFGIVLAIIGFFILFGSILLGIAIMIIGLLIAYLNHKYWKKK